MLKKHLETESQLGKILIERRLISERELREALAYQVANKVRIGEALTSLNFVSTYELKRALKRQSWLRSFAAVALMSAPITSALAAGNGSLEASSSASSQISLTILPKTQAQSNGELKFSSSRLEATESGFCPSEWGAELFRVKLIGSGLSGGFYVSNEHHKQLPYRVSYKHQQQAFQPIESNTVSRVYSNRTQKKQCQQAFSNQLKVAFSEDGFNSEIPSSAATYNGVLTVTFSAE